MKSLLSGRRREILNKIVNARTNTHQLVVRSHIILLADKGISVSKTARLLNISRDTVYRWRGQWIKAQKKRSKHDNEPQESREKDEEEEKKKEKDEFEEVIRILEDQPRSGTPAK